MANHTHGDDAVYRTHEERFGNLEGRMTAIEGEVAGLKKTAETNALGVSNFKKFQLDATGKINFIHGAAWAWSVILLVLLGVVGYGLREIIPVAKAITLDYYERHPNAKIPQKPYTTQAGEEYANRRTPPQDAKW